MSQRKVPFIATVDVQRGASGCTARGVRSARGIAGLSPMPSILFPTTRPKSLTGGLATLLLVLVFWALASTTALAACPLGQIETRSGLCVPAKVCPPGQVLTPQGQCVAWPVHCPPGYIHSPQGACVPLPCQPGQVRNSRGQCVYVRCPSGQTPNAQGQCVPIVLQSPPFFVLPPCPRGEEHFHGQCLPICPYGMVRLPNGKCSPIKTMPCPTGTYKRADGKCVPFLPRPNR